MPRLRRGRHEQLVGRFVNLTQTEYGSWTAPDDPGEPTTKIRRISVTDQEARLLTWWTRDLLVVEIGTGLGVSTRAMATGANTVHTIDPDPWVAVNVHLPPNVVRWNERPAMSFMADLVFIDADHRTEAVTDDINWALAIGVGVIVCHDSKMESVGAALDDTWIHVDTHHGLALKIV